MSKLSKKITTDIAFIPDALNRDLEQLSIEEAHEIEGGEKDEFEVTSCDMGCEPNDGCNPPINYVCTPTEL